MIHRDTTGDQEALTMSNFGGYESAATMRFPLHALYRSYAFFPITIAARLRYLYTHRHPRGTLHISPKV